jgi:hypothetical protein
MARRKLSQKTRKHCSAGLAIGRFAGADRRDRHGGHPRPARHPPVRGPALDLAGRVYAQPLELYVGQSLSSARFAQELARLGYIPTTPVDRPGTFKRNGDRVDVYVRAFRFSDEQQAARKLRIGF